MMPTPPFFPIQTLFIIRFGSLHADHAQTTQIHADQAGGPGIQIKATTAISPREIGHGPGCSHHTIISWTLAPNLTGPIRRI